MTRTTCAASNEFVTTLCEKTTRSYSPRRQTRDRHVVAARRERRAKVPADVGPRCAVGWDADEGRRAAGSGKCPDVNRVHAGAGRRARVERPSGEQERPRDGGQFGGRSMKSSVLDPIVTLTVRTRVKPFDAATQPKTMN